MNRPLRLLTVPEIAGLLRVSKMTVYRLIQSGELSAYKIGGSYRVNDVVLAEYLNNSVTDGFTSEQEDDNA